MTIDGYSQVSPLNRKYATHIRDATHLVVGVKKDAVADELMKAWSNDEL